MLQDGSCHDDLLEDYNEGTTQRSGCADPACRAAILQRSVNPESQPRGMNQKKKTMPHRGTPS